MCKKNEYRYVVYDNKETLVFETGSCKDLANYFNTTIKNIYVCITNNRKIKDKFTIEKYKEISDEEYNFFITDNSCT